MPSCAAFDPVALGVEAPEEDPLVDAVLVGAAVVEVLLVGLGIGLNEMVEAPGIGTWTVPVGP